MKHSEIITNDGARHAHFFQRSSMNGVVNFPVEGPKKSGFYFTKVKIGNPPKEFHLTIDTGSDLTWVNCIPCVGCPNISSVVPLHFYDPHSSSSAEPLSCSGRMCRMLPNARHPNCASSSQCDYSMIYGDGSEASGYYILDAFHFDTFVGNYSARGSTHANVVFGCTNHQYGDLTHPESAFDGLLGFGQHPMSILSQLEYQGGTLALGEIVEPVVPKQTHYNVDLLSISINGQTLPIDPKVFSISRNRLGTIFDSGTTYSYLTEEAYDPFLSAISAVVPPSVISYTLKGSQCFETSNRDVFPIISLNFAGGASLVLKPEAYLLYSDVGLELLCVGFRKNQFQNIERLTVLGELFLKDKIIVYDLAQQRLGWVDYDCGGLSSVNVSLVPPRVSCSSRLVLHHQLIPIAVGGFFVYISMFTGLLYL